MFVGNFAALAQTNIKRMLAYSSIAHAGYILVALAAAAAADQVALGVAAVLFYLAVYALMKWARSCWSRNSAARPSATSKSTTSPDLATRQPVAAACFSLFLLSLLGLPVTAGFLGKFYIFNAALASHLVWLAVLLAINSVIAAFYYLRVIVVMYMREPDQDWAPSPMPWALTLVLVAAAQERCTSGYSPDASWASRPKPRCPCRFTKVATYFPDGIRRPELQSLCRASDPY